MTTRKRQRHSETGDEVAPARGSCASGKVAYTSRAQAKKWARRLHPEGRISAYLCSACTAWHLGHAPTRVRNGTWDKTAWLDRKDAR